MKRSYLEQALTQFDHILVNRLTAPPPIESTPTPSNPKPDEPPWHSPSPGITPAEHEEGVLKKNLGYDPSKSWRDIDADQFELAEKRLNQRLANPNGASFTQDEEGLANAYNDKTAKGVYYDPNTRTEYVKGSVTGRDWYDDFTKVPFGNTRDSERYQQADKAYDDLLAKGKVVDRVVGHSLGGSVALDMQKNHGIPQSRTFGAPVLDVNPFGHSERYRHPLDPVSILDRGATWGSFSGVNPLSTHSYTGFGNLQSA